ncbi:uncharacterized protein LOC121367814 isoform X2 [Gigantopelta aegis]|uniref:uncharacterized protein LOC121367814 isoform X2 n=1 Tax=Gigantopelta aegis TaxID=1735272 RepID=UPI001B88DB67|nr:uncharacterized protein LOC121367814 isoform X2 [Gigantopelta aegis]
MRTCTSCQNGVPRVRQVDVFSRCSDTLNYPGAGCLKNMLKTAGIHKERKPVFVTHHTHRPSYCEGLRRNVDMLPTLPIFMIENTTVHSGNNMDLAFQGQHSPVYFSPINGVPPEPPQDYQEDRDCTKGSSVYSTRVVNITNTVRLRDHQIPSTE